MAVLLAKEFDIMVLFLTKIRNSVCQTEQLKSEELLQLILLFVRVAVLVQ